MTPLSDKLKCKLGFHKFKVIANAAVSEDSYARMLDLWSCKRCFYAEYHTHKEKI